MQGTTISGLAGAQGTPRADTPGLTPGRLVLASQSPRRKQLLEAGGVRFEVVRPGFEDDHLRRGRATAAEWCIRLR